MEKIPKEIPYEQMKCPRCQEEMNYYEDKETELRYCEKCNICYKV